MSTDTKTEEKPQVRDAEDIPVPTLMPGEMDVPLLFFDAVPVVVEDKKVKVHAYEVTFKTRIAEEQFPWLVAMLKDHKLLATAKNQNIKEDLT